MNDPENAKDPKEVAKDQYVHGLLEFRPVPENANLVDHYLGHAHMDVVDARSVAAARE